MNFVLNLSIKAYRKLSAYAAEARSKHLEISGLFEVEAIVGNAKATQPFGYVRKDPEKLKGVTAVFNVPDIHFLSGSNNTAVETTIDPAQMQKFLEDHPGDLAKLKGWWHCHPLPTGWSSTDELAITTTPLGGVPALVRWSVSLVHTTVDAWIARYDQYGENPFTATMTVAVEGDVSPIEKECYQLAYEKMKKAVKQTYGYIPGYKAPPYKFPYTQDELWLASAYDQGETEDQWDDLLASVQTEDDEVGYTLTASDATFQSREHWTLRLRRPHVVKDKPWNRFLRRLRR